LIGADDASADSEILKLLIECLRQVGLRSFRISLGHVGFFRGLLVRAGLSPDGQKRAEQAAARKDLPKLEEILIEERVSKASSRAILEAPELSGHAEVLEKGRSLARGDQSLLHALNRLTKVYQLVCSAGYQDLLFLDLGEFRGFDYYDGVVFDVFADGIGVELGGGGRYDHLIGRFGRNVPSTGFALNVDRLFHALNLTDHPSPERPKVVLVVSLPGSAKQLMSVSGRLRESGSRVAQQVLSGSGKGFVSAAAEAGVQMGADLVVIVEADAMKRDRVLMLQSTQRGKAGRENGDLRFTKRMMPIKDILALMHRPRAGAQ
jgi:ATP phosphoribosyltransferase regulatory subunit